VTTPPPDPGIGRDEWVDREVELRDKAARVEQLLARLPVAGRLGLVVAAAALLPVVISSDYIVRVAVNTLIYALLALGLNLVVGWAGLLDLGYVAFYGFGAYSYALLSSNQFHLHWPTAASVPLIVAASALLGILIGLPSRRLLGDYLAILTLFFAQAFVTLVSNANRITPPGHRGAVDFTGGPNGIADVDNVHLGSHAVHTVRGYFYLSLIVFVIVVAALYSLNNSRTGRAWRSQREDPLAAEAMGMPVNWLKLMSFSFGAAVAALTGTLFAAQAASVFPLTFYFVLLIIVYTMVILGGSGSQAGVVAGALIVSPLLELLRDPGKSRVIFFIGLIGGLLLMSRRSRALGIVALATLAFGFAVHEILGAIDKSWIAGEHQGGFAGVADHWVVAPAHLARWIAPTTYIGLIAVVLLVTLVRGRLRLVLLVPTLYLAAFVWENVMLAKPEPARYIVLGIILIALMILRPNGLLGERRVEIV
jgi:ABC-type branched-subunit amino acid transport system permease subunit